MIEFACPECGRDMRVADSAAGKRGKCKDCNATILVPAAKPIIVQPKQQPTRRPLSQTPVVPVSQPQQFVMPHMQTIVSVVNHPSRSNSLAVASIIIAIVAIMIFWVPVLGLGMALLALVLAGFGLLVAITRKGTGLVFSIAGGLIGVVAAIMETPSTMLVLGIAGAAVAQAEVAAERAKQKNDQPVVQQHQQQEQQQPKAEQPPVIPVQNTEIAMRQTYRRDEFELTVKSASIAAVPLKQLIGGDEGTSEQSHLILEFTVTNPHDRKILRVRDDSIFKPRFKLVDDVNNAIRGIDFGIATKVIGAIQSSDDIAPGASHSHIEVFSVPPPKTQFLLLTADCSAFGSDGTVVFKIPAASITGL